LVLGVWLVMRECMVLSSNERALMGGSAGSVKRRQISKLNQ
jgi:hypothetical protein